MKSTQKSKTSLNAKETKSKDKASIEGKPAEQKEKHSIYRNKQNIGNAPIKCHSGSSKMPGQKFNLYRS